MNGFTLNFNNSSGNQMYISNGAGAFVGIGTMSPLQKLHVAGNIQASGNLIANYPANFSAGQICRDGTGRLGDCASDKRLKENIYPLTNSGLDLISKLKPSNFDFKKGPKNQIGFIAQDVLEVLPQAVTTSSDGYYGLNDMTFTPYLVKALQELDENNKLLNQKLDSQEQQIEELRQEIRNLKSDE